MDKKQERQFKGKIIQALRKLSYTNPDRKIAFDKAKVESATHECCICKTWCYGGESLSNFESLVEQYPDKNIIKNKAQADHIKEVIPTEGFSNGSWDWHEYIERLHFCGEQGWQIICVNCHNNKTNNENKRRKK